MMDFRRCWRFPFFVVFIVYGDFLFWISCFCYLICEGVGRRRSFLLLLSLCGIFFIMVFCVLDQSFGFLNLGEGIGRGGVWNR